MAKKAAAAAPPTPPTHTEQTDAHLALSEILLADPHGIVGMVAAMEPEDLAELRGLLGIADAKAKG